MAWVRAIISALLILSHGPTFADEEDAIRARVMWAAFECAVFAGMSDNATAQVELFERGLAEGRTFFAAAQAGDITEDEWRNNVPVAVSLLAAGPTIDFIIGRVFETVAGDAFDKVVKEDANGLPLRSEEWRTDPTLIHLRAEDLFRTSNCELL